MIEVKNLSYTYNDGNEALKSISVSFPEEHIFAVTGMSGSGKTTLLNCLARFIQPQQGEILLNSEDISQMDEKTFRSNIGVVSGGEPVPHLTVLETCPWLLKLGKGSKKPSSATPGTNAGASRHTNSPPITRRRSAAVQANACHRRGLMLNPVMLLDEPTSALDARTSQEFSEWLRELRSDTGFIIVTHDLPFAELAASKGIFMSGGVIVKSGPIRDVLTHIDGGLAQ